MMKYLNPIDRKGLELSSTERRCNLSVKKFERFTTTWAESHGKETLAKFQTARGKETSDDKRSDNVTSKAADHKQKSDASTMEFCRKSLSGGNV